MHPNNQEVKIVPTAPWFDLEYKEMRKERRKAEKRFHRTGKIENREVFKNIRKQTTKLALLIKQLYYTSKVNNAENKPKELFKIVNKLRNKKQESGLPTAGSDAELAS